MKILDVLKVVKYGKYYCKGLSNKNCRTGIGFAPVQTHCIPGHAGQNRQDIDGIFDGGKIRGAKCPVC